MKSSYESPDRVLVAGRGFMPLLVNFGVADILDTLVLVQSKGWAGRNT